jgi:hypothetical protein
VRGCVAFAVIVHRRKRTLLGFNANHHKLLLFFETLVKAKGLLCDESTLQITRHPSLKPIVMGITDRFQAFCYSQFGSGLQSRLRCVEPSFLVDAAASTTCEARTSNDPCWALRIKGPGLPTTTSQSPAFRVPKGRPHSARALNRSCSLLTVVVRRHIGSGIVLAKLLWRKL